MTTLSQIAADVRRLAADQYPTGLAAIECVDGGVPADAKTNVARLALIGAMVLACRPERIDERRAGGSYPYWSVYNGNGTRRQFIDTDHANDPLLSLHAAFLWAKGGAE